MGPRSGTGPVVPAEKQPATADQVTAGAPAMQPERRAMAEEAAPAGSAAKKRRRRRPRHPGTPVATEVGTSGDEGKVAVTPDS